MSHMRLGALALAAAALAGSGCGESSKSATETTATTASTAKAASSIPTTATVKLAKGKPLTRASWIAKGDAICAPVDRKLQAASSRSRSEYTSLLPRVALYLRIEAAKLSKLTPPASMRTDAEQLVSGIQLLSEYLSRAGMSFRAGYAGSGNQLFRTALTVQRQPFAIARRDGFTKCTATR
jgi:hypothetical protein